jgi:serine phosphatase RsbU (regulator of sigma subunit)
MLGISFLNDIIKKDKNYQANIILNLLRENIKSALQQKGDLNEQMDGMDLALCVFDFERKKLQFSGAKNSLILIRNNELIEYKGDKMPIGISFIENEFSLHEMHIEKGDVFYMFSDGYVDQTGGEKGKKFMTKNFHELLFEIHHNNMQTQREILDNTIENWKSHLNSMNETYEQTDDILVLGVKYELS